MTPWAGLLFVRKTYCLSCNGLAEDNKATIHHSLIKVVPSCPALSLINTTTLTTIDNNSSLLNYGCPSCPALSSMNTTTLTTKEQQFITP